MVDIIKPYLEDNTSYSCHVPLEISGVTFNREFSRCSKGFVALGSHIPVVLSILGVFFCENYMPHDGSMGLDILPTLADFLF